MQTTYYKASGQYVLPVNNLPGGIYLLSFKDEKGTSFSSKLVVKNQ